MNEMQQKRIISFSVIRVIGTLCVVLLHTCYMAVSLYGNTITKTEYISSMTVTHLMMVAVPLFVMITGALLLDPNKEITIEKILKKYVLRILIALIIFSAIYKIFDIVMSQGTERFGLATLKEYFTDLISGAGWSHLWYLYMLIALYLLMPAFRAIVKTAEDHVITYLLIVGFIFMCIVPIYRRVAIPSAFYIDVATVYPVYLFAGYAVYYKKLNISCYSLTLFVIGTLGIIIMSMLRYSNGMDELDAVLGYSSPFTFIASLGIFDILSHKEITKKSIKKIISTIDPAAFGIYLIHIIFLRLVLRYIQVNPFTGNLCSVLFVIAVAAVVFIISMIITIVLKKIPGINKIV